METYQEGFSGRKAAEIVGISYRQLDYWARTDLVRPSLAEAQGSGSRRRYSYRDLLELKVIKQLLDAGIKLESVREVFAYLQEHLGEDVTSANLVINGRSSVVVATGDELVDVFNVLALGGVKSEVDAAIVELRPAQAAATQAAPEMVEPTDGVGGSAASAI
jgi:DNA-binding transcriptional MerR regulator